MLKQVILAIFVLGKIFFSSLPYIIFLCLLLSGVAVSAELSQKAISAANQALTTAIQLDNQCATSEDCTTVAVGARACGGPNGYAVYSIKSSNAQDIRLWAQLTTTLEHQYNTENSVMSICSIVIPPEPVCDETKKCVAGSTFSSMGPVVL